MSAPLNLAQSLLLWRCPRCSLNAQRLQRCAGGSGTTNQPAPPQRIPHSQVRALGVHRQLSVSRLHVVLAGAEAVVGHAREDLAHHLLPPLVVAVGGGAEEGGVL